MADDRFTKKEFRALVDKTERLPLLPARTTPVRTQLERWSDTSRMLTDAIPQPVKTISRHSFRICSRVLGVLAIVLLLAVAGAYLRLMQSPVSFAFLVPTIQSELNTQIKGYRFRIGNAVLQLSNDWGLEFRLTDVSLNDDDGKEIAKAPSAAIDMSETSLMQLSVAPSSIELIDPKVLVFTDAGTQETATSQQVPQGQPTQGARTRAAGQGGTPRSINPAQIPPQAQNAPVVTANLDPGLLLGRLFGALEARGGSSSALKRIGVRNAAIYFVSASAISEWKVPTFHIDIQQQGGNTALSGELDLVQDASPSRLSFKASNRTQQKSYLLEMSAEDVSPEAVARSFPTVEALRLVKLPMSATARVEISHGGNVLSGNGEIKLGKGIFYAPWDKKHPAAIDSGMLRVRFDKSTEAVIVEPLELRWDDNLLTLAATIAKTETPNPNAPRWSMIVDGRGTRLGAQEYGVPAIPLDVFRLAATYDTASGNATLNDFTIKAADAQITLAGSAADIANGGDARLTGTISPMPLAFLKVIWPTFVANGAKEWVGENVPAGRITGGSVDVNLSRSVIADLKNDGDVPDSAVSFILKLANLQIYHVKGLPPIRTTQQSIVKVVGRHFRHDIPEARIEVPSGKPIQFSDGYFVVDDLREEFPDCDIGFKAKGDAAGVLELLDQPPLGYVKAVGFKSNIMNGQVATSFKLSLPLLKELKFKQLKFSGKTRVSELKSNGLPGGIVVNGGAVSFDVTEAAISATGEMKVNGVPVSLAWQRILDAPPEKQPTLRLAGILTEKARDDLALNVNHIVKGDLPIALAVSLQKDGPPKLYMEANLTGSEIFLTAIGWRKPNGQRATLSFDLSQRADNYLVLDNFKMVGDNLAIDGQLVLNDKRRIANFDFPQFSTNQLTRLAISGELAPQNILKIRAKGAAFDGRQFFKSILSSGKTTEAQPAPQKDEPGLDLAVEIETLFGHSDATLKSVVLSAKRRAGKLTYLDVSGRLNGQELIGIRVDQKSGQRLMIAESTDAGSTLRLIGLYNAMRGGLLSLRLDLDGGGQAEKTGTLTVRNFVIAGDQVLGKVVTRAEQENTRQRPGGEAVAQAASSGAPLQFDRMTVPFSTTSGQFILHNFAINGPVLGATMRGSIDLGRDALNLSGTYVPLYGLNSVLGGVPLLGELLGGREGVLGITFAVQGRMGNPDVRVNPLSMVAPGFLRQLFEFDNNQQEAAPREIEQPKSQRGAAKRTGATP